MADLGRIKSNVAKMVAQSAPEADIDAYLASEGVTPDQVRQFATNPAVNWQGRERTTDAQVQPQNGSQYHNPLDRFNAIGNAAAEATPFVGPQLANWGQGVDAWLENNVYAPLTGNKSNATPQSVADYNQENAAANPAADITGKILGNVAPFMVGGEIPVLSRGLGMATTTVAGKSIPLAERMAASGGSMFGINTGDQMARGASLPEAVQSSLSPAAIATAVPALGAVVRGMGKGVADFVTKGKQAKVTNEAIKGAPTAAELSDAGSALFDSSTGGTAPMVSANALDRLWNNVSASLAKYRPNAVNDPQAVGLLQHIESVVNSAKQPGAFIDFKDLHLSRQLAGTLAKSPTGRDKAIGSIIIKQIDDFIASLKPADILGGKNPGQAANDLLQGIGTWARAKRVGVIEDAIKAADTYKSGLENGLKLSFLKLMKSDDFAKFSKIEQDAIRTVAKGTTTQNIAEGLGKLGFSLGGSAAHNILGAGVGTMGLTAALTPFLGPVASFPAALATTSIVGAGGRRAAESIATKNANKAAGVFATPNAIPQVPQAPNLLAPPAQLLELMGRGFAAGQ